MRVGAIARDRGGALPNEFGNVTGGPAVIGAGLILSTEEPGWHDVTRRRPGSILNAWSRCRFGSGGRLRTPVSGLGARVEV
jgi:hypothetical protein